MAVSTCISLVSFQEESKVDHWHLLLSIQRQVSQSESEYLFRIYCWLPCSYRIINYMLCLFYLNRISVRRDGPFLCLLCFKEKTISGVLSKYPLPFRQLIPHWQWNSPINCCFMFLPHRGHFFRLFFIIFPSPFLFSPPLCFLPKKEAVRLFFERNLLSSEAALPPNSKKDDAWK